MSIGIGVTAMDESDTVVAAWAMHERCNTSEQLDEAKAVKLAISKDGCEETKDNCHSNQ